MAERKWTTEQKHCIDARGGSVLVSAAAGSGKTSVLIQRIIGLITDDVNPIDINRMLVVTFTKSAAAEMRLRLSDTISSMLEKEPTNRNLLRQQSLIESAGISTVDSFCAALLRTHFQLAGLSADFRVAEEADSALLMEESMTETLEMLYNEGGEEFLELAEFMSDKRDDSAMVDAIRKIYDFTSSHTRPDEWMDAQSAVPGNDVVLSQTPWGKLVIDDIIIALDAYAAQSSRAIDMAKSEPVMAEKYLATFTGDRDMIAGVRASICDSQSWDGIGAILSSISFATLPQLRNYHDEAFKKKVTDLRNDIKAGIKKLPGMLCGSEKQCRDDIAASGRIVSALFNAVRIYTANYKSKKLDRNMVDFGDLERSALNLLYDSDGVRTPLADQQSEQYDEIMVDEYQDTNFLQDAIFRALSREGSNLFMVGDVKQSVYGFRNAMPEIFLRRRDEYTPYDGKTFPAAVVLGNNFRSRPQVTDAVNYVFHQIMRRDLGGVEYDERERLIASADYPPADSCDTELILLDGSTCDSAEDKHVSEARLIAARINELMQSFTITENGSTRPAQYSDFCILLRSGKSHGQTYAEELRCCGIPVWTASPGQFFRATEIGWALSMLRVIDNPVQDVPMLAVLLSPMWGFTPDDIAEARMYCRQGSLFTALHRYVLNHDGELAVRFGGFMKKVDALRILAATLPVDRLIHRMYEETALTSVVRAMRRGSQRTANLRLLHSHAARFGQNGFRGLSAFMRMMDKVERRGGNFPLGAAESGNAVSIMTIHKSKGLEFPVVFLAGLGSEFMCKRTNGQLLPHINAGIGIKRRDSETLVQWKTLPYCAAKIAIERSERAEELRLLYVGMTRAKEKLCMVMYNKEPQSCLARVSSMLSENAEQLPRYALMKANSAGEWVLMAALRHPSAQPLRELAGMAADNVPLLPADYPWIVRIAAGEKPFSVDETEISDEASDSELAMHLEQRMAWQYSHAAVSALPSKLAASKLAEGMGNIVQDRSFTAAARPAFLSEDGLTPAERGTALHAFMQFCDLNAASGDVQMEIKRLTDRRFITPQQADAVSVKNLVRFFRSELYARMQNADRCMREVHFTIDMPAGVEDEIVIVQGIADCVLEENGELVIIDYKTDRVSKIEKLYNSYAEQLRVYAYALSRTVGLPVNQCLLYSFHLDSTIEVDIKNTAHFSAV